MSGRLATAPGEAARRLPLFRPTLPYHMVWLATNACNARCVHCSSDSLKCRPAELTTGEAMRMFEQMREAGVFDVAVSGGEPLVRPDLFEILEHARDLGFRIGLGSNGSTVTEAIVRRLVDVGIDRLQISIDGVEETHDRARRFRGLYRRAIRAIEAAVRGGLRVHVCFTAHRMNHAELEEVAARCIGWGVRRLNVSRFVPTGRGDASLDLSRGEWRDLALRVESLRRRHAGDLDISTHLAQLVLLSPSLDCTTGFVGCQAGAGQGCIGPEGEVMPCVMLPIVVGNVRDRPLREIWETSEVLDALRDRSRLGGACGECWAREKCGGCRAVAHAGTGDYLASDPRCWKWEPGGASGMEDAS